MIEDGSQHWPHLKPKAGAPQGFPCAIAAPKPAGPQISHASLQEAKAAFANTALAWLQSACTVDTSF